MHLLLTTFFSAIITLAVVHITALEFFLYWKYLWFDIPMHILGGVCIALGFGLLPFFRIHLPARYRTLFAYILVVILVGIIWEIFEYTAEISTMDNNFVLDTIFDLCMDTLGGLIGYSIVQSTEKLEHT